MKIDFKNQTVLITGATRGIGKQLAEDFELLGASLILTGTKKTEIKALNNARKKRLGSKIIYYCVDFTDQVSTEGFIKELGKYKKIDVCVNNAGINKIDYIDKTRIKDWNNIISVNLKAPFLIMRKIAKIMKKNKYGRIINISSIFGLISKRKRAIYSASKSGMHGLTLAASAELARHNILVNTVSPGFVLTSLTKSILSKKEIKELEREIPIGRLAKPDDISKVVIFLTSSFNTYVTGQNVVVDGGYVNV